MLRFNIFHLIVCDLRTAHNFSPLPPKLCPEIFFFAFLRARCDLIRNCFVWILRRFIAISFAVFVHAGFYQFTLACDSGERKFLLTFHFPPSILVFNEIAARPIKAFRVDLPATSTNELSRLSRENIFHLPEHTRFVRSALQLQITVHNLGDKGAGGDANKPTLASC